MEVAISVAKARLTELVRQAEAGEEVVLTRRGQPVVRLAPLRPVVEQGRRRALLDDVRALGRAAAADGPDAAHSQDFLYDDDGLPA